MGGEGGNNTKSPYSGIRGRSGSHNRTSTLTLLSCPCFCGDRVAGNSPGPAGQGREVAARESEDASRWQRLYIGDVGQINEDSKWEGTQTCGRRSVSGDNGTRLVTS